MLMTVPVHDMIMLPGISFYFKTDLFQKLGYSDIAVGDDVLFLMMKEDLPIEELTDYMYPDSPGNAQYGTYRVYMERLVPSE